MNHRIHTAADKIAGELVGHNQFVATSFNVYDVGTPLPQIILRGIPTLEEAFAVGKKVVAKGATNVAIVAVETQVRVVERC